jgi:hypothetical protein
MKSKPTQGTITSTEVRALLSKAAKTLSAREEKALRMRHGAGVGLGEPLPRRGQEHPDARAELLALEIDLRNKQAARGQAGPTAAASPQPSRSKDKIVRALRRLK